MSATRSDKSVFIESIVGDGTLVATSAVLTVVEWVDCHLVFRGFETGSWVSGATVSGTSAESGVSVGFGCGSTLSESLPGFDSFDDPGVVTLVESESVSFTRGPRRVFFRAGRSVFGLWDRVSLLGSVPVSVDDVALVDAVPADELADDASDDVSVASAADTP